jgi:hypothetical protein
MWTKEQNQYLREVLGVNPALYPQAQIATSAVEASTNLPDLIVYTPELSRDEKSLLDKVLSSVGLSDFKHVTTNQPDEDSWDGQARNVFLFSNNEKAQRVTKNQTVIWRLHSLPSMIGNAPEVAEKKRAVWNLLKEYQKEQERK